MSMTPFEIMQAAKSSSVSTERKIKGRKRLSDAQRDARKIADRMARQRGYHVLRWKYREELNAIVTEERRALYALIDEQYAAGEPIVLPEN